MIVESFGSIKVQDFRQFIVPEETIKKEKGFEKLDGGEVEEVEDAFMEEEL